MFRESGLSFFDLLFIVACLSAVVTLIIALALAISGHPRKALKLLLVLCFCTVGYLATGLAVSRTRPQHLLSPEEPWCFDDWCLKVEDVTRTPALPLMAYNVHLRIFSRARRVAQRAKGAWIFVMDENGNRYFPDPDPGATPLDVRLEPLESITTSCTFRVPANVQQLGLITGHGGPYCGVMSFLIIGQAGCVFNKPTMIRIR